MNFKGNKCVEKVERFCANILGIKDKILVNHPHTLGNDKRTVINKVLKMLRN